MDEQVNGVPTTNGAEVNITDTVVAPSKAKTTGALSGIYGATATDSDTNTDTIQTGETSDTVTNKGTWKQADLPVKVGFWGKVKSFLFQEIKVELTPGQQKIEDEVNAFLFKEISFFGKRKA